jgi:hypothetical protein
MNTQAIEQVLTNRLAPISNVVILDNVTETEARVSLISSEDTGNAIATTLNMLAVRAISLLNAKTDDCLWCTVTAVRLEPIDGTTLTLVADLKTTQPKQES